MCVLSAHPRFGLFFYVAMRMLPHLTTLTVFLLTSLTTGAFAAPRGTCKNPATRKEWRSLGHSGQKAYVDAIKVCVPFGMRLALESVPELCRYVYVRSA